MLGWLIPCYAPRNGSNLSFWEWGLTPGGVLHEQRSLDCFGGHAPMSHGAPQRGQGSVSDPLWDYSLTVPLRRSVRNSPHGLHNFGKQPIRSVRDGYVLNFKEPTVVWTIGVYRRRHEDISALASNIKARNDLGGAVA